MQAVLAGISDAKPQTSHGKRMWTGYSKTKAQRDVSAHCTWVKRTLASFNQELLAHLDVEYSSGTAWLGDYMVASATRSPPVTVEETDMVWDDRLVCRPWIWVSAVTKFTGIAAVDLKAAFAEFKR